MYRAGGRHEILQERRARRYRTSLSAIAALSREMGFVTRSLNLRISISAGLRGECNNFRGNFLSLHQRREASCARSRNNVESSALIHVSSASGKCGSREKVSLGSHQKRFTEASKRDSQSGIRSRRIKSPNTIARGVISSKPLTKISREKSLSSSRVIAPACS